MPSAPSSSTTDSSHGPTVFVVCRSSTSTRHRRSTTSTTIFGFRDRLSQPLMKGSGEEPTPGSGAARSRGSSSWAIPTRTGSSSICLTRCCRATAVTWRTAGWRNTWRCSARIRKPRMTRSCVRRSSWAAGAEVRRGCWHGTRMTRNSAQIHCATTTSLQGDGSVRLCGPARLARPLAESARHGALHESSANDPVWGRMGRHSPSPLPTMGCIAASPRSSSARTAFDGSSSRRTRGSMHDLSRAGR